LYTQNKQFAQQTADVNRVTVEAIFGRCLFVFDGDIFLTTIHIEQQKFT